MTRAALLALLLSLAACKSDETRIKAIIGGVLIDGTGGAPVSDSVIIVTGSRVRLTGPRANVPIPAGSDKIDARGKFVLPLPVDLSQKTEWQRVATLAEAQQAIQSGAKALRGMVSDTTNLDPGWIGRLRALEVVFAPALAEMDQSRDSFKTALANTGRLSAAGVRIAVASKAEQEIELLSKAGLSPMDLVVASTRNAADALSRRGEIGTIEQGKQADLVVVAANPLEDPRRLSKPERTMRAGEWIE